MNGLAERDAIFLMEMGIAPLWHLRNAPAAGPAAAPAARLDDEAGAAVQAVAAALPVRQQDVAGDAFGDAAPAPAPVDTAPPVTAAASPQPAPAPSKPPPRAEQGPRPLQRVAQSV